MKYIISLLFFFLFATMTKAQENVVNLLAQSPEGKTVKLVWFFNIVNDSISGFDIKRKDGLDDWKKLNSAPILPGISFKKDLTPAGPDNIEASRIRGKLKELLKNGILTEYSYTSFMEKWRSNDKEIQDVFSVAELDFDVSLMCGFGFIDRTVTQKMDYRYGLFIQGTNTLLASVSWNYGEVPNLNVVKDISSRVVPGSSRGVKLIWSTDATRMKAGYVAGFNIYKRGIRLNDRPVTLTDSKEPGVFSWDDVMAPTAVTDQYSISAESLFGIEGTIKSYTYNPDEHPGEYKRAEVTSLSSVGYYFKDGFDIQWTFPEEYEKYIKGFYVEKDNMPAGYVRSSELLPPGKRSYIDKTGCQANYYIRVRVVAVYNDQSYINGTERLFSYFSSSEAPKPQNTTVKSAMENRENVLYVSWASPIKGDNATVQYNIYQYDAMNDKFTLLADKLPAKTTTYKLPFVPGNTANYKFYVTGVNRSGIESIPSDVAAWQPAETGE